MRSGRSAGAWRMVVAVSVICFSFVGGRKGRSGVCALGSESGEAEGLVGVLVDHVGVERGRAMTTGRLLDLAQRGPGLDELQDVLVLAHGLLRAARDEAEGRLAQVAEL